MGTSVKQYGKTYREELEQLIVAIEIHAMLAEDASKYNGMLKHTKALRKALRERRILL